MDIANLTDEELNVLHRRVSDEWIKRNVPTEEDLAQMTNGADELLRVLVEQSGQAMKGIPGA